MEKSKELRHDLEACLKIRKLIDKYSIKKQPQFVEVLTNLENKIMEGMSK